MPTYEWTPAFGRDWADLTDDQQVRFLIAVRRFVADLEAGGAIRSGLGVRPLHGQRGMPTVYRFTWDEDHDGRATFHYGTEERGLLAHVVWRRIGGHRIYTFP
jgi:hypothetical protein